MVSKLFDKRMNMRSGGDLMSKDSALIATFIGALFVITAVATGFYITHPAAAVMLYQMPPA